MIKFSEMKYTRPDINKVKEEIKRITEDFESAESYEVARENFLKKDELVRHIMTEETLASIRHSIDTRDTFYEEEEAFWNKTSPVLQETLDPWTNALCSSKFRNQLAEEFGEVVFINAELELKSFASSIVPLLQKENELTTEYEKLLAGAQIPFQGKIYTIAQIGPYKSDINDETRLSAWKAEGKWYKENQADLDRLYGELVSVRHEMSQKLEMKDYVELGYYRMTRNCYDREDIARFRDGVRKYLVPVAEKIRKKQAERMGFEYPMSFSDNALMFRSGNAKPVGSADDILAAAKGFYDELSPETSEFFNMMLDGELMDLLSTEGKEGGGYCTSIYDYDSPFIFANFNGTKDDVETVTHEAGHAFADWVNRKRVPAETIWPSMEACEVHSMSMEFFAWKASQDFFGADAEKFKYSHLAEALLFIPYGTMVDHFQHIVFEHPELSPSERHDEWKRLLGEYMPWLRLDGEIPFYSDGMGWQRQHHIYSFPFYYIDYCLAQTVALEFWAMMQDDYGKAWEHYMSYTRQGGSEVFTKLIENAGLESPFEEKTFIEVCGKAEHWLDEHSLT